MNNKKKKKKKRLEKSYMIACDSLYDFSNDFTHVIT